MTITFSNFGYIKSISNNAQFRYNKKMLIDLTHHSLSFPLAGNLSYDSEQVGRIADKPQ